MTLNRHLRVFLTVLGLAALVAGCQPKKVPPTVIQAVIQAAPDINPAADGTPSPLVIRIYPLKSTGTFENADFFTLYEKGQSLLASDLTGPLDELDFVPGERKEYKRTLRDDTKAIGIVAAYREVDQAVWRAVVQTPAHQTTKVLVRLGKLVVAVQPQ